MESCKFAQPLCGLLHLAVWIQYIQTDLIYTDPDIYEGKKLIAVFVLLFFHTYYVEKFHEQRGKKEYLCVFAFFRKQNVFGVNESLMIFLHKKIKDIYQEPMKQQCNKLNVKCEFLRGTSSQHSLLEYRRQEIQAFFGV